MKVNNVYNILPCCRCLWSTKHCVMWSEMLSWLCCVSIPALYKQSLGQDRLGAGGGLAWPGLAWLSSCPHITSQSTLARPTVSPLSLAKLGNTGGAGQWKHHLIERRVLSSVPAAPTDNYFTRQREREEAQRSCQWSAVTSDWLEAQSTVWS